MAECSRSRNPLDTDRLVRFDPVTCDVAAAELVHGLGVGLFCCQCEPLNGLGRQVLHEEQERQVALRICFAGVSVGDQRVVFRLEAKTGEGDGVIELDAGVFALVGASLGVKLSIGNTAPQRALTQAGQGGGSVQGDIGHRGACLVWKALV